MILFISDYNLPQQKIYSLAGHILTVQNNISAIEQLIKCCHTSGIPNSHIISDYVLSHCVKLLINRLHNEAESVLKNDIYILIRLITDIELKVRLNHTYDTDPSKFSNFSRMSLTFSFLFFFR